MTDASAKPSEHPAPSETAPTKIDWADPHVPAGNAPPLPRWPLVISAVVFGLWICFLIAMAVLRFQTTKY